MAELNRNFDFEQGGKTYNLYNLPDGFVIEGDVNLLDKGLSKLPDLSKVKVEGNFLCCYNQLTSLEGAPREVGGDFRCDCNKITSLQGAPQEVGGEFWCNSNKLTSLEGAPETINSNFHCDENELTSLKGAPKRVGGNFHCYKNKLTSLIGAPEEVGGYFRCGQNELVTLGGAPRKVGKTFECQENKLVSLRGAPAEIGKDFWCHDNPDLQSLIGVSKMSEGHGIRCDDALRDKYGFTEDDGFIDDGGGFNFYKRMAMYYKDLIVNPIYQNEVKIEELRQKKHEEKKQKQAQLKAGFEDFKSRFKPDERED